MPFVAVCTQVLPTLIPSQCEKPADVIVLVESTGPAGLNIKPAIAFVKKLAESLSTVMDGVQLGVMIISDENTALIQLNQATSAAAINIHLDMLRFNLPKLHLADGKMLDSIFSNI